ncbi:hypothetical protein D3C73_1315340 [compost metagenome]
MDQLGTGAHVVAALVPLRQRDHLLRAYPHIFQQGRAAGGNALAHAVPIIEQGDAGGVGGQHHVDRVAGLVQGLDFQQVGKQAAGAVELVAIEHQLIAATLQARVDFTAKGATALGNRP